MIERKYLITNNQLLSILKSIKVDDYDKISNMMKTIIYKQKLFDSNENIDEEVKWVKNKIIGEL